VRRATVFTLSLRRVDVPSEGVLVAPKNFNAPKHGELDVPNLEVIKAMQSLTSKGFVKTRFSWQWYYYVLTPEGVEYLREWYVCPL
jgi:small subunit ribosomal protein S10e